MVNLKGDYSEKAIRKAIKESGLTKKIKERFEKKQQNFRNQLKEGIITEKTFFNNMKSTSKRHSKHYIFIGESEKDFKRFLDSLPVFKLTRNTTEDYEHEKRHATKIASLDLKPCFGVEFVIKKTTSEGKQIYDFATFASTDLIGEAIHRGWSARKYFEVDSEIANIENPSKHDNDRILENQKIIEALENLKNTKRKNVAKEGF